jgi:hypothetical protein
VPNSKTFTALEKATALSAWSREFGGNHVIAAMASDELNQIVLPMGYERLRRLGAAAPPEQHFIDGTMLFADVASDIYIDDCCHINADGTAMIWATILANLERRQAFAQAR